MTPQRNATLEIMKLFASYMVVFIHVLFYGRFGIAVDALARFAVPFFFLVSGFYSYQISPEKIRKRAKNILFLFVFGMVCYNCLKLVQFGLSADIEGILLFIRDYFDPEAVVIALLFNKPAHGIYMWYLLAALYVYIFYYIVAIRQVREKFIFPTCIILLFLQILFDEFGFLFNSEPPVYLIRNFALMGIPFFGFGLLAKKYAHKLESVPNHILIFSAAIGILETLLSRQFSGLNQLYIGSLFILFPLVVIFIKHPHINHPRFLDKLSGCSTYIYIFHVMVTYVLEAAYGFINLDYVSSVWLQMIHPLLVCFVSTMVAYIVTKIMYIVRK